jgi:uncharacterized protein YdhG (YjbR/CyaY superfamily)
MTVPKGIKTIDDYIATFPASVQDRLQVIRNVVKDEAPTAKEAIKYGMPTFTLNGNLVYFGAWKNHIGFYPITTEMETAFEEISQYKTSGKGTIQFPMNQPLPLPLIRKIVAFRIKQQDKSEKKN